MVFTVPTQGTQETMLADTRISLPRRPRGRPTATAEERYQDELERFCEELEEIDSGLEFKVSSRGWCYILEEHGLTKGDFNAAQRVINDARKSGLLPVDFCSEDDGRQTEHLKRVDDQSAQEFAQSWVDYLQEAHEQYRPF